VIAALNSSRLAQSAQRAFSVVRIGRQARSARKHQIDNELHACDVRTVFATAGGMI